MQNCQKPDGPRIRRAYDGECKGNYLNFSVANCKLITHLKLEADQANKKKIQSEANHLKRVRRPKFLQLDFRKIEIFRLFGKVAFLAILRTIELAHTDYEKFYYGPNYRPLPYESP